MKLTWKYVALDYPWIKLYLKCYAFNTLYILVLHFILHILLFVFMLKRVC